MKRLAVLAGVAAVGLAACSSQPGDLSASAQRVLVPKAQAVRDAAASGSYSRLTSAVHSLERLVDSEQRKGQVSDTRAAAIKDAADSLLTDASPSPTPTVTPSSPSPTQTAPSSTPSETPTSQSPSSSVSPTPTSSSPSPGTTISVGGITAS